jgi:hypothetical protein
VKNELGRKWKIAFITSFKVLSMHLHGETDEQAYYDKFAQDCRLPGPLEY